MAIAVLGIVAATSEGCSCGGSGDGGTGCGSDCNQACQPPLDMGLPGSYTSVAKAKDGTIWVAGYNDALIEEGDAELFGDLVVGQYDLGKQQVQWLTVDGTPPRTDGTCPAHPKDSWRNGEDDAGDDVGLYTSIQLTTEDHPLVSYYDATNHQLKMAVFDGQWSTFVVKAPLPGGDAGRYAKLVLGPDGNPIVAFLQTEPGPDGKTISHVVVGRAHVPTPRGGDAFSFEDAVAVSDNPCNATSCAGGTCLATGDCAPNANGCTPADCGGLTAGKACVTANNAASCELTMSPIQTYPNVFGDFVSLASGPSGLGIAVYDRVHGNLVALEDHGSAQWTQTIIDGETGDRTKNTAIDTGDVGIASSLFIDADGTWHLSYVSGLDESLRYITYSNGKAGKSEIVDDGSQVDGAPFPDGTHVVGDDSTVRVDGDVVTIYYQDATTGTLRRAAGSPNGDTHVWELRQLPQPNRFAGFFPVMIPGEDKVANFWRQTDHDAKTVTGDVAILSP